MESSLPMVKPVALKRPRGAHRFEAFSPKLQRRLTFCRRSLLEMWMLLETDPAVIDFCERPGYIRIEGHPRLADFLARYVDRTEFVILTECDRSNGVSEVASSNRSFDCNALFIRRVGQAELAAARAWIDNWHRMLPYVVANRGHIPATMSVAIVRFVAVPQRLLAIEREFSTGDPAGYGPCGIVRLVVQREGQGTGASHPTIISVDVICGGEGRIMSHWKPELQAIDVSAWPTVAYAELGEAARRAFERRREAVVRYAAGESVKSIELSTGVNRRQLYRLLERAMLTHRDGRPFGFRVLVPYTRIAEYRRVQAVVISRDRGSLGAAGALSLLFEQYPALAAWLRLKVRQRKVLLVQIHTDSGLRTRLQGLRVLHDEFLCQCRTIGLSAADYPFNTSDHAIRSLSRRVKAELLRRFDTAARSAGASHLKGLPRPNDTGVPAASRPYQVVEFDGHRLDIRLKVVTRDPLGFEHEFEIERAWLLVIIDVCTRAVLGYHIALGREYRYDVVKTIENALEPHRERGFTIAGLAYGPQDGFPSQRLPELAYATWEWMKLDNGRANLANGLCRNKVGKARKL